MSRTKETQNIEQMFEKLFTKYEKCGIIRTKAKAFDFYSLYYQTSSENYYREPRGPKEMIFLTNICDFGVRYG